RDLRRLRRARRPRAPAARALPHRLHAGGDAARAALRCGQRPSAGRPPGVHLQPRGRPAPGRLTPPPESRGKTMTISTQHAISTSPWAGDPAPSSPAQWLRRADEVAAILEVDAVERDRALRTPHAEVQLLKQAGLVTLLGPASQGGGGQSWETAYQVIRRVAQ